jgi:hypothetical protein
MHAACHLSKQVAAMLTPHEAVCSRAQLYRIHTPGTVQAHSADEEGPEISCIHLLPAHEAAALCDSMRAALLTQAVSTGEAHLELQRKGRAQKGQD